MRNLIIILLTMLTSTKLLAQNDYAVGSISILKGYGWILRRVTSDAVSQKKFHDVKRVKRDGKDWYRFPIQYHKNIIYGDRIETSTQGRAIIKSESWGELHLGANSSIFIAPNFNLMYQNKKISPTIYLYKGIVRVQTNHPSATESMVVGLARGHITSESSDFIAYKTKRKLKVFNLEGSIQYHVLSQKQSDLLAKMNQYYLEKDYKSLVSSTKIFTTNESIPSKNLLKNQKISFRQYTNDKELDSQELSDKIKIKAIEEKDYRFILLVLYSYSELSSVINTVADPKPSNKVKRIFDASEYGRQTDKKKSLSVRVAGVRFKSKFDQLYLVPAEGTGIELTWRPLPFIYSNLGTTRGTIDMSGIANIYGQGEPTRLNIDYHINHINGGLYFNLWNLLDIQLGYGIIDSQDEVIRYKSQENEISQTYTISFERIPYWEIGLTLYYQESWEIFANYGEGTVTSSIRAEEQGYRYGVKLDISFARVGVGCRF